LVSDFVYVLARLVIAMLRIFPRSLGETLLKLMATCVYYIDFRHRHIAGVNLQIAFPDLSIRERKRIARRSFQNTAMNLLEISKLPILTPENISSLVEYDVANGLDNYISAHKKGKGILYLTGHFSSWELLPAAHALHGHPLSFVTRPLDNARLDQYLLRIRESKGNRVLNKKNSARHPGRSKHEPAGRHVYRFFRHPRSHNNWNGAPCSAYRCASASRLSNTNAERSLYNKVSQAC
jgi:KDO2-lipid IV(A) lauroyltransferase